MHRPYPRCPIRSTKIRKTFEFLHVTVVNSDNDVMNLLDTRTGRFKLTSPYTIFLGGMILDRGLPLNLIGFFYGRNPQRFQQDTVLQHSRMYGARPKDDLPVTRFYTTERIYEIMKTIHEFDSNLRDEIKTRNRRRGGLYPARNPKPDHALLAEQNPYIGDDHPLGPTNVSFQSDSRRGTSPRLAVAYTLLTACCPRVIRKEPFLLDVDTAKMIVNLIATTLKFNKRDYKGGRVPGPDVLGAGLLVGRRSLQCGNALRLVLLQRIRPDATKSGASSIIGLTTFV